MSTDHAVNTEGSNAHIAMAAAVTELLITVAIFSSAMRGIVITVVCSYDSLYREQSRLCPGTLRPHSLQTCTGSSTAFPATIG